MALFQHARFIASAAVLDQLPPPMGAEIAFVGRSNAGKSSAINALAGRRRLAFVSKTPGRTQLINLFDLGAGRALADLPGYGYAAVPAEVRARWSRVVSDYLKTRANLSGIVLIMDIRHPLGALDRQLLDWIAPRQLRVHILLTKADKLAPSRARATLETVAAALARTHPWVSVQLFSSLRKAGIVEAERVLEGMLLGEGTNKKPPVKGE